MDSQTFIEPHWDTKEALLRFLLDEKSKQEKSRSTLLKDFQRNLKLYDSFEKLKQNFDSNFFELNQLINKILHTQEIRKYEKDPILYLLNLNPEEALEEIKYIIPENPYRESFGGICNVWEAKNIFEGFIENQFQPFFNEKISSIENRLDTLNNSIGKLENLCENRKKKNFLNQEHIKERELQKPRINNKKKFICSWYFALSIAVLLFGLIYYTKYSSNVTATMEKQEIFESSSALESNSNSSAVESNINDSAFNYKDSAVECNHNGSVLESYYNDSEVAFNLNDSAVKSNLNDFAVESNHTDSVESNYQDTIIEPNNTFEVESNHNDSAVECNHNDSEVKSNDNDTVEESNDNDTVEESNDYNSLVESNEIIWDLCIKQKNSPINLLSLDLRNIEKLCYIEPFYWSYINSLVFIPTANMFLLNGNWIYKYTEGELVKTSSMISFYSSLSYLDNYIYVFSSNYFAKFDYQTESFKFNVSHSFEFAGKTSSVGFKNHILIVNNYYRRILVFDVDKFDFEEIAGIKLSSNAIKNIFTAYNRVYILECPGNIYRSAVNDFASWEIIGTIPFYCHSLSYVVRYNGKIYFKCMSWGMLAECEFQKESEISNCSQITIEIKNQSKN